MSKTPRSDPAHVLSALGDVRERLGAGVEIYVAELLKWNRHLGLVSKREPERTIVKLVRQSIALWDFVVDARGAPPVRVVDVGTGGGFPGMIWRLLDRELEITLVERRARKAAFIERVLHLLGAPRGVTVVADDIATVAKQLAADFDTAVMMAVAPDAGVLEALDALLLPTGAVATVRPTRDPAVAALFGPEFVPAATQEVEGATFLLLRRSEEHVSRETTTAIARS